MAKIDYRVQTPKPDAFAALFETTGWNEEYRATAAELTRALENSWYVLSVYDGERLVGTGRLVSDGAIHAMVFDVIVHPTYQHRGIGSEILRRLVEKCRSSDIRDVQLFCARGKQPFYERQGFRARPADAPGMQLDG